jgi:hypothetical protein
MPEVEGEHFLFVRRVSQLEVEDVFGLVSRYRIFGQGSKWEFCSSAA